MNIEIDSIKDSGNLEKERVIFKVTQACNLGKYIAALSVIINDTTFSSALNNISWFPDQELKKDDLVVLYTKRGDKSSTVNEDGSNTYFYYWGLDKSLSSIQKSCVVLLEASWKVKTVPTSENN